jgi:hypothetical protein
MDNLSDGGIGMNKAKRLLILIPLTGLLLGFFSCQEVFTYSLAQTLARTDTTYTVTSTSDALSLTEEVLANGDATQAQQALEAIYPLIANATGAERQELIEAATELALASTDVSATVLETLNTLSDTSDLASLASDPATMQNIMDSLLSVNISDEALATISLLQEVDTSTTNLTSTDYILAGAVLAIDVGQDLAAATSTTEVTLTQDQQDQLDLALSYAETASEMESASGSDSEIITAITALTDGMVSTYSTSS